MALRNESLAADGKERSMNAQTRTTQRTLLTAICILASSVLVTGCASSRARTAADQAEAVADATDAYIYGYPLVTMEMTRRVMTNVQQPMLGKLAPMGQFAKLRTYPSPEDKQVTAPNADTLYTLAWLDLSAEPWVLSIPDMKGRYFLMPMLDGWTNVFQVPGKRTTGTAAQEYAITGPDWQGGPLPSGVVELKSPTNLVWILGRIYCSGTAEDYRAVHALQDQFRLEPLNAYRAGYTPPPGTVDPDIDMRTPVRAQVDQMDAESFFTLLATLMKDNPPTDADAPMVAKLAKLGIYPGKRFDRKKLDKAVAKALPDIPKAAQAKIMANFKNMGTEVNGWMYSTGLGLYGTKYLNRATTTAIGLGANRPRDAIYPTSAVGVDKQPYSGAHRYVIHFDKGKLPPVKGFWSLTMYNDEFFFVPNALNRYTLSSRSKFQYNKDGSVDLYLQHQSPGKALEANWLPAPAGRFVPMLRLYWPNETPPSIFDGTWKIPPLKRADLTQVRKKKKSPPKPAPPASERPETPPEAAPAEE